MVRRMSLYAAVAAACVFALFFQSAFAQSSASPDHAAGRMVDSLFEPHAPGSFDPNNAPALPPRRGVKRPALRAKLVRNSSGKDGAPAYALVDKYGGILRYVEPVDKVKLEPYVGRIVGVRHDTGDTLLASQLIFPPRTGRTSGAESISNRVQQAAFQEPIPAGKPAEETLLEPTPADESESATGGETYSFEGEEVYMGEGVPIYDDGMALSDCPGCIDGTCSLHTGYGYRTGIGQPVVRSRAYLHGEYLLWWFDGMDTPPLVTTSNAADGGVLPNFPGDNASTVILFGGDPILEDSRHGFRVMLGVWMDEENRQSIEADYLFLGELEESYFAEGEDGNPIISRPFFEIYGESALIDDDDDGVPDFPPGEAAQQVSSDNLDGSITITSRSDFQGAGLRLRHNLFRAGCAPVGCGTCVDCGMGMDCALGVGCGDAIGCGSVVGGANTYRYVDFLAGVRWYQLNEELFFLEDLVVDQDDAVNPADPAEDGTRKIVIDQFSTDNDFTGGELGFDWGIERNRWSLELLSKIAVGSTRQRVRINGSTQQIPPDATEIFPPAQGGLLALPTNIGEYERDRFSMIPELNFTVGYKLTQQCKLRVGYTIMYWTNVARPGDQIDRQLNTFQLPEFDPVTGEQLPPITPLPGPLKPEFVFRDTNVLIQGMNIGMEYNW